MADLEARDRLKVTFGSVARQYVNGRPTLPAPAAARLLDGLGPSPVTLDVGAGSGQLARPLAAAGARVTAVEPLVEPRDILAELAAAEGLALDVVDGTAEALPAADGSVDLVTCGDAFHWFDAEVAIAEFVRVLRPGGRLCISYLQPAWTPEQSGQWGQAISELFIALFVAADHPMTDPVDHAQLLDRPELGPVEEVELRAVHRTDGDGLLDYFGSTSVISSLPAEQRALVRDQMRAALAQDQVDETTELVLDHAVHLWITQRR